MDTATIQFLNVTFWTWWAPKGPSWFLPIQESMKRHGETLILQNLLIPLSGTLQKCSLIQDEKYSVVRRKGKYWGEEFTIWKADEDHLSRNKNNKIGGNCIPNHLHKTKWVSFFISSILEGSFCIVNISPRIDDWMSDFLKYHFPILIVFLRNCLGVV